MISAIVIDQVQEGKHSFNIAASAIPQQPHYPHSYGGGVLFPWRLHEMLEAADTTGFSSVVSWLPDQRSFKVHDKETFVSLIMGQYFEQTKFKSFQRQLNMWGFERLLSGPGKGGYTHPMFLRGQPSLCVRMSRSKKKSTAKATERKSTMEKSTPATIRSSKNSQADNLSKMSKPPSPTHTPSSPDEANAAMTALHSAVSVVSHHDDECSAPTELDKDDSIADLIPCDKTEDSYPQFSLSRREHAVPLKTTEEVQNEEFAQFEGRFFFPISEDELNFSVL